ncbi:Rpn family recombination-promoting nuclease/putative transposase [uncultured Bacteroides sp.]|uniref:Rpn family recombination-promoting nuclease/putative transposase n=1 Tax=uncultured Bacteroides sp. TaxID=162156 RepID=UPI0025EB9754|nr:Rpn family recombination-promoting nuclease/putative transposase [uncultured Bacteroides sp.]
MPINELKELYIDPRTDFGFKYLFGTPMNKELLIGFLNALFHGTHTITDLTYLNSEQLGIRKEDRRAIFDVYCETESGDKFIVEMQNVFQQFFKDRSVYYSTFPIREQAKRGDWEYRLEAVYTIGILNFVFDEDKNSKDYFHHEVKLMDVNTKKVFYDKLTFIYLELPKFTKTEHELETLFEKWVFVLKNLSRLLERPAALQERVFNRLFEAASIARFTPKQLREYEDSVKAYRDIVNAVNTARMEGKEEGLEEGLEKGLEKGREEGREEERIGIARTLKTMGLDVAAIHKATGLTPEEIQKL